MDFIREPGSKDCSGKSSIMRKAADLGFLSTAPFMAAAWTSALSAKVCAGAVDELVGLPREAVVN